MDLVWGFIKSILFGLFIGLLIGVFISYKLGWVKKPDKVQKEANASTPDVAEA